MGTGGINFGDNVLRRMNSFIETVESRFIDAAYLIIPKAKLSDPSTDASIKTRDSNLNEWALHDIDWWVQSQ
jgi:hypothetical protein